MKPEALRGPEAVPERLARAGKEYQTALVYPPFGPSGLPNLGLALLGAGLKARGLSCRTFYWNLDLLHSLTGRGLRERLAAYRELDGRLWHPFNEWIFASVVYEESARRRVAEAEPILRQLAAAGASRVLGVPDLLALRDRAEELVAAMVERLGVYHLVGISTSFFQNLPALALARRIKERWPEKQVVLGGANCDGEMGRALLDHFPFVDAVFSGEVDHAFPDFVARLACGEPIDDVPGMIRRLGDGGILEGPAAVPLQDLDGLPLPDYDDYLEARRQIGLDAVQDTVLALESSRGCWWGERNHCTFCGLNANGMAYRQKSPERFQWEVETIVSRYQARYLFMADNILSMRYYREFMGWARKSGVKVDYFYEIKANVNRQQAQSLAEAGITAVQPGIESFSSKILALMRKGTTGIQNIAFLKYAREYGIYTAYNILVDFPGEDATEYERMTQQIPKLVHLRPPSGLVEVEFHRFSPYHQAAEQFGLRLRPSQKYDYLYPLPSAEIARLAYLFERENTDGIDRSYLAQLRDEVIRWRRTYEEAQCALTWRDDGGEVVIEDKRPAFPRQRYRLRLFAATVFHSLDAPRPLSALVNEASKAPQDEALQMLAAWLWELAEPEDELVIAFDRQHFLSAPHECLAPLVAAALIYQEDGRYLALPVKEDHRPAALRWLQTGV